MVASPGIPEDQIVPESSDFPDDRTAAERRKGLTGKQIRDLELAGGVEGGMQAGSGSPRPKDEGKHDDADDGAA